MAQEKIVKEDANQRIVSYYSSSRETIVTDTKTGRIIKQIPRKNKPFSIIYHLIIFLLLCLPAYFALTVKENGVLVFPAGEICTIFPICFALLFVFANRKSITVTIENDTISQIVQKGNRIISQEKVELKKVTGTSKRFGTTIVTEYEAREAILADRGVKTSDDTNFRYDISKVDIVFKQKQLGHGNETFRCLDILGESDGKEITLMELKFYDSTGNATNALYASNKVEEELIKLGVSPSKFVEIDQPAFKDLYPLAKEDNAEIKSAKKYFMKRFGPAFFMLPAYCADCNKKPVYNVGRFPLCPECNWQMDVSSWDRFRAGAFDGSLTVEEFENLEKKTYMNENFLSETLNQNSWWESK